LNFANFEKQIAQITSTLIQAGIITPLPGSGLQGVIGFEFMQKSL
jgi:hypothetical protein